MLIGEHDGTRHNFETEDRMFSHLGRWAQQVSRTERPAVTHLLVRLATHATGDGVVELQADSLPPFELADDQLEDWRDALDSPHIERVRSGVVRCVEVDSERADAAGVRAAE